MFCSDPKALSEPYRRYLLGALREHLPFAEVPIKLYLRKRQPGDKRAEIDSDADPDTCDAVDTAAPDSA
jgi:GTP-binding protein